MIPKMRTYYYGFKKFKCEEYDIKMRRSRVELKYRYPLV